MEKKLYITPAIDIVGCAAEEELLTVSSDDYGIGFGGEDNGDIDAAARGFLFYSESEQFQLSIIVNFTVGSWLRDEAGFFFYKL